MKKYINIYKKIVLFCYNIGDVIKLFFGGLNKKNIRILWYLAKLRGGKHSIAIDLGTVSDVLPKSKSSKCVCEPIE